MPHFTAAKDAAQETRDKLIHIATQYDIKESNKKYYNRYALAQYFKAIDGVVEDVEKGMDTRKAICASFNGRLCAAMLKALGLPEYTKQDAIGF